MGAGERETLGRTSGASAELLACGDGGLKPPVEKRVKPVSQLYCRNFIAPSALFQLYRYIVIVPTVLCQLYHSQFYNVPTILFPRVTKSENFPDSKVFVAKTFRMKRVNRANFQIRDKCA